jgi:hypothetical protein
MINLTIVKTMAVITIIFEKSPVFGSRNYYPVSRKNHVPCEIDPI